MKKQASFLCSILLFALAACHSGNIEKDYTNSLKIGYVSSTDILPYIVAQQQGIYDSLKLDLKLMPMESELNRDTLFQQKKTDGSILSPIEALSQQEQKVDIVPTLTNEGLYYIVTENDSTFIHLKQLENKCLSVARGSASSFFADHIIAKLNINQDAISEPELSRESIRMQMLCNKQIDAAVLNAIYTSEALKKECKSLTCSSAYPLTLSVTAFSDSILHAKKEDIKKLIIGYNLAVNYMNSHPQEKWLNKATSAAGLPEMELKLPAFKKTSKLPYAHKKEIAEWMKEKRMLPKNYFASPTEHPIVDEIYKEIK